MRDGSTRGLIIHSERPRRLNLLRALGQGATALPRLWGGAWAALVHVAVVGAVWALCPPTGTMALIWGLWTGFAVWMAWGALVRIGVSDSLAAAERLGLGPGGVQFGAGERRMGWAAVLIAIFLAMIAAVLVLVLLVFFGIAELDVAAIQARDWAAVGPGWKLAILGALAAMAVWIPLVLVVRLSLFAQVTMARGEAVSLNTMGVAHGAFWSLLALILLFGAMKIGLMWAACCVWPGPAGRLGQALGLALIVAPYGAGVLGAAYRQLEYWSPEGRT